MEQRGKVVSVGGSGTAHVAVLRQSACSGDCHKCAGCGAVEQTLLVEARNPICAAPGDSVVLSTRTGPVLAAAAVLYLLPPVLFLAGYLAGALLLERGGIGGCCGFLLGLLLAVIYDRRVAGKRKIEYTITGFVPSDGA